MPDFKSVVITGVAGSGGSYLAEYIVRNHPDVNVHGFARWHSTTSLSNIIDIRQAITLYEVDLLDFGSVHAAIRASKPDAVFHLASFANVLASFKTPAAVLNNNVVGTSNLFEAIRSCGLNPKVMMCSTSEVYGQVAPDRVPIREDTQFRPASPYAVSKCAQDLLANTYFNAYHMPVVTTRMFTYINPRRGDLFATSFARQVARVERNLQSEVRHGNLDSVRTMLDVRDAMHAYWLALQHGTPGEAYNIGGTTTMSVGEFLQQLISMASVPIPTVQDLSLLRPADVTLQIPCIEKFVAATRWQPVVPFDESVRHLLDVARSEVATQRL